MVKITDGIEIHDGVALVICRHDVATSDNLNGTGGVFAYAMGKYAPDYFRIDPPEHIIHSRNIDSPIVRTRNTAKLHRIAQGVMSGVFPDISYDVRLREGASGKEQFQAAKDAIEEAQTYGYKTIELVTHASSPVAIGNRFGAHVSGDVGYGGMVVVKADSWEDMLDPSKPKTGEMITSSHELVEKVLGKTQMDILNYMMHPNNATLEKLADNPEIQKIWEKLEPDYSSQMAQNQLNAILKAKDEETKKWTIKLLQGEDVDTVVPPNAFMEMFDAYKYWMQNLAIATNIAPVKYGDVLQSELMEKLMPLEKKSRGFIDSYLVTEDGDDLHPIFNAYANKLEKGKFSARKAEILARAGTIGMFVPGYADAMEEKKYYGNSEKGDDTNNNTSHRTDDHPLLYAFLAAKMRKDAKKK